MSDIESRPSFPPVSDFEQHAKGEKESIVLPSTGPEFVTARQMARREAIHAMYDFHKQEGRPPRLEEVVEKDSIDKFLRPWVRTPKTKPRKR